MMQRKIILKVSTKSGVRCVLWNRSSRTILKENILGYFLIPCIHAIRIQAYFQIMLRISKNNLRLNYLGLLTIMRLKKVFVIFNAN